MESNPLLYKRINNIEDYDYAIKYGFNPFLDPTFIIDIETRYYLQKELFQVKGNLKKSDVKFYRFCWKWLDHYCEETGIYLRDYSAVFVSHILSRGAYPEMRWDIRNINILSFKAHQEWEFGTFEKKQNMKIWSKNEAIIESLRLEYNQL